MGKTKRSELGGPRDWGSLHCLAKGRVVSNERSWSKKKKEKKLLVANRQSLVAGRRSPTNKPTLTTRDKMLHYSFESWRRQSAAMGAQSNLSLCLREVTRGLVPTREVAQMWAHPGRRWNNSTFPRTKSFEIIQHFFLAPNDPIFSAHIPSSDSMDATYFIKPTNPHEIGFWNTHGTPPAPPNIPTSEEVQNNKNINVWAC